MRGDLERYAISFIDISRKLSLKIHEQFSLITILYIYKEDDVTDKWKVHYQLIIYEILY